MRKALLFGVLCIFLQSSAHYQKAVDISLHGCWEVLSYSEQGLQVDKKAPALSQAIAVYSYVQRTRAQMWYGYYEAYSDEYSRRELNSYRRWEERDSAIEVQRVAEAIATPYYAIFFPDSTLSCYNQDSQGRISYPDVRLYSHRPASKSIDIYPQGYVYRQDASWSNKIDAQILYQTDSLLTLFLPEEAEIVKLKKVKMPN